jgi:gamma-glutamylputrescine oxidase
MLFYWCYFIGTHSIQGIYCMQVYTYYDDTSPLRVPRSPLQARKTADVVVIGGGITGCRAALELAKKGMRVCVLEKDRIGAGASGRSGGQVLPGFGADLDVLETLFTRSDVAKLWNLTLEGVETMKSTIRHYGINCDYRDGHYTAACTPEQNDALKDFADRAGRYGYPYRMLNASESQQEIGTSIYWGTAYDAAAGHVHPLNYTLGLADAAEQEGAEIFEGSAVRSIELQKNKVWVHTAEGRIVADYLVLGGNAYLWPDGAGLAKYKHIASTIMPVGTYMIATAPLTDTQKAGILENGGAVADTKFVLDYYRLSAEGAMLFGGGVSYSRIGPPSIARYLEDRMHYVFPQLQGVKAHYAWGGDVAITRNRLPDLGWLAPNVVYAQGFSGHGMAFTNMAGTLMAEAITGTATRFDMLERIPHKPFPGGASLRTPLLVLGTTWMRLRDALS